MMVDCGQWLVNSEDLKIKYSSPYTTHHTPLTILRSKTHG